MVGGLGIWNTRSETLPQGVGLLDDPAALQLLPVEFLRAQAAAAGLRAHRAPPARRSGRFLVHARALREHGRRAGAPELLARAAKSAQAAVDHARNGRDAAAGRVELARCAMDAAELGGDAALMEVAWMRLAEAEAHPPADGCDLARLGATRAVFDARRALEGGTVDAAHAAASELDAAALRLARAARAHPELTPDLAQVRCVRAELLTGFALRLRDAALAARAALDMEDLCAGLDVDRAPLCAARAARLLGEALTVQGELTGEAEPLSRAADLLARTLPEVPSGHSPIDRARLGRALGHAARALGESCDTPGLFDIADRAFAQAAAELAGAGPLPLCALIAFERAMNLARRGEAHGDVFSRARAEAALKAELVALDARRSPAAWAATQVALARLYAEGRRAEAAVALSAALDVFAEEGLASLAQTTADELRRLAG